MNVSPKVAAVVIPLAALLLVVGAWFLQPRPIFYDDCLSRMKNLGTMSAVYAEENGGRLPILKWGDALAPILKQDDGLTCQIAKARGGKYGYAMAEGLQSAVVSEFKDTPVVVYFEANKLERNLVKKWTNEPVARHKDGLGAAVYSDCHGRRPAKSP